MDDTNNLYKAKMDEKQQKRLQEGDLSKFLKEYQKNISEIESLEKKVATALNNSQFDYAGDLQSEIDLLRQRQEDLKENARALTSYEKAMKSVIEVEEKARKSTELHNSYLENKNKVQKQQSDKKAKDKLAKEESKKRDQELKNVQTKQKQYWEDVLKHQDIVAKGYEQVTKTLTSKQNQYIQALANDSTDKAKGLKESIKYWKEQKDNLLREINNSKFTSDFYDVIKDIDVRNNLSISDFEGGLRDKVGKTQLKEDLKSLKEFVNEYDRLYKKITDEKLKVATYNQKGETVNAQAHKNNLSRIEEELNAHKKTIEALKHKEEALKEIANIEKHYENTLELGMANVGQKIQTSTYKEFNKLQDELVSKYKELYNEQQRFEKSISKAVNTSEYDKLSSDLEKVKDKLKEVKSQIVSQDHLGKIELFEEGKITAQSREVTQSLSKIKSEAEKLLVTVNELKNSEYVDRSSLELLETSLNGLANTSLDKTVNELRGMNAELSQAKNLLSQVQSGIDDSIFQSNKKIELGKISDSIAKFKKDFNGVLDNATFEALESSARRLANIMDKDSFSQGAKELTAQLKHARNQMDGLVESSDKYNFFEDLYTNMRTFQLGDLIFDGIQSAVSSAKDIIIELDSAMANVKKVADPIDISSIEKLDQIKEKAIQVSKEVGMASSDVINSIADTVQSGGYRMEEAIEIARQTMMLANVGEMSADSATKGVVSMLSGFNLSPLREMQVEVNGMTQKTNELTNAMDMVNYVG